MLLKYQRDPKLLENLDILTKLILPNDKLCQGILDNLLKIAAGNEVALEAYLHLLKYKISCAESDNLRCYETNFT